jgi:hypothetical protein
MTKRPRYLRRYTDLAALFYLLNKQSITLLDPQTWDDRNDSYYLRLYKKKRKLKSVLALCFTEHSERYHFWRVFGAGSSGVRIRFRRADLLEAVEEQSGLRYQTVEYVKLSRIGEVSVPVSEFPFVKRYGFQDEKEFRMIYESESEELSKLDVRIPLKCIDKIVLSPWLHPDLFSHVEEAIQSIKGCDSVRIVHSSLIDNEKWKSAGRRAIKAAG